ncbi:MAG: ornithine carbamoyltransferase [Thermodesulfobacteriota bacterium]|nr:ornithine carbamoyltransferase [Thermodesulfobacteriota bacterium]
MKKDITTLTDLNKDDCMMLFSLAADLKARAAKGIYDALLAGRVLGLLFDKPSTRTRVSFEAAMYKMGGATLYMSAKDMQISRAEPVKDTARVLSRYIDVLAIRTYSQELIETYSAYAGIPVINALSDLYHPCQVLSDLMTVIEQKGGLDGVHVAWVGDGNNVANSWINACSILGFDLTLACPDAYQPDASILDNARQSGIGNIHITNDPEAAVANANVIYTDVWASMGQEEEQAIRQQQFAPFQVNEKLVAMATPDVIVMHCLPAHRGEEIEEAVLEGPKSVVWAQAENKMHMHKAILKALIENNMK